MDLLVYLWSFCEGNSFGKVVAIVLFYIRHKSSAHLLVELRNLTQLKWAAAAQDVVSECGGPHLEEERETTCCWTDPGASHETNETNLSDAFYPEPGGGGIS